jgi:glutamate 5-kinase
MRTKTMTMMPTLHSAQRVVIKTGSALVTHEETGQPRYEWMASLAQDIHMLRCSGKQVILVSSGAVSLGRNLLGLKQKQALQLDEKQAAAACGQVALMDAWKAPFAKHGCIIAQLLLTLDTSEFRRHYLNARNTLETLLELGAVPIVNENDTVATAELRIGDNDRLAARVAEMAGADTLLILSDIDGFYTANPTTHTDAIHIPVVNALTPEIEAMAGNSGSAVGTGGMVTKLQAAKIAHGAGCHTWIGAGRPLHPVSQLMEHGGGTWFPAHTTPLNARKRWIRGMVNPAGSIIVDAGAAKALLGGGSLLAVGITAVHGAFDKGDAVRILSDQGKLLGKGLAAYDSNESRAIMGKKSDTFEALLGYKGKRPLIHRDDLALE